jgi:hypothetical protein
VATVSTFDAFVDDATALRDGVSIHDATASFGTDRAVGSFVLRDTDVPLVRGFGGRLAVVVTGGAGQVAGPAGLCRRLGLELGRLDVALRDPDDPLGAARRVVVAVEDAVATGSLDEAAEVHVEIPAGASEHGWLAAADEVAVAGHRLSLPATSPSLLTRIDAALDREAPFSLSGVVRALPEGGVPGFLNVLVATQLLFDGGGDPAGALAETDLDALLDRNSADDLARGRRWVLSFASTGIASSLADLATIAGRVA